MLYGYVDGNKRRASPRERGLCPYGHEMMPKCGQLVCWHWAHLAGQDCDPWQSEETEWHLRWKSLFPDAWVEKIMRRELSQQDRDWVRTAEETGASIPEWFKDAAEETHIADVATPHGTVIEFQHSPIPAEEISERNEFYGPKMIWVFDFRDIRARRRVTFRKQPYGHSFRWYYPRKTQWQAAQGVRAVFWDTGDENLFLLKKVYSEVPCGGWGRFISKNDWLSIVMST